MQFGELPRHHKPNRFPQLKNKVNTLFNSCVPLAYKYSQAELGSFRFLLIEEAIMAKSFRTSASKTAGHKELFLKQSTRTHYPVDLKGGFGNVNSRKVCAVKRR